MDLLFINCLILVIVVLVRPTWHLTRLYVQTMMSVTCQNHCGSPGSCRTSSVSDQQSSSSSSSHRDGNSGGKKVEVIDLTLDSSDDDDDDDDEAQHTQPPPPPPAPPLRPPSVNRACPSMSPTSPPIINKGSADGFFLFYYFYLSETKPKGTSESRSFLWAN